MANTIEELSYKFGVDLDDLKAGFAEAGADVATFSAETTANLQQARIQFEAWADSQREWAAEVQKYANGEYSVYSVRGVSDDALSRASGIEDVIAAREKELFATEAVTGAQRDQATAADEARAAEAALKTELDALNASAETLGRGLEILGGILVGLGSATILLRDDARQMEASFATTALAMNADAEAVEDLGYSLQSVTDPIADVAGAMDYLSRAGVDDIETMGRLTDALGLLSTAVDAPASSLARTLVPALQAMNEPLANLPQYVDGFTAMFRESTVEIGEFSSFIRRVGPDLQDLGLSLTDVMAIVMALTERGIEGYTAFRKINEAIREVKGAAEELETLVEQQERLGDRIEDTAAAIAKYEASLSLSTEQIERMADATDGADKALARLASQARDVEEAMADYARTAADDAAEAAERLAEVHERAAARVAEFEERIADTARAVERYRRDSAERAAEAVEALADAHESAADRIADYQERIEATEKAVARYTEDAAEKAAKAADDIADTHERAAERITDYEEKIVSTREAVIRYRQDAIEKAADAEERLAAAHETAAEKLADYDEKIAKLTARRDEGLPGLVLADPDTSAADAEIAKLEAARQKVVDNLAKTDAKYERDRRKAIVAEAEYYDASQKKVADYQKAIEKTKADLVEADEEYAKARARALRDEADYFERSQKALDDYAKGIADTREGLADTEARYAKDRAKQAEADAEYYRTQQKRVADYRASIAQTREDEAKAEADAAKEAERRKEREAEYYEDQRERLAEIAAQKVEIEEELAKALQKIRDETVPTEEETRAYERNRDLLADLKTDYDELTTTIDEKTAALNRQLTPQERLAELLGISLDDLKTYNDLTADGTGKAKDYAAAQEIAVGTMDRWGYWLTTLKQQAADLLAPLEPLAPVFIGLGGALAFLGGLLPTVVALLGPEAVAGGAGLSGALVSLAAAATSAVTPVLLLLGALSGGAAILWGMWTASEDLRTSVGNLLGAFSRVGDGFMAWAGGVYEFLSTKIGGALKFLGDFYAEQLTKITDWMAGDGAGMIEFLQSAAAWIGDRLVGAIGLFVDIWQMYVAPPLMWLVDKGLDVLLWGLGVLGDWFTSPAIQHGFRTASELLGEVWTWMGKVGAIFEAAAGLIGEAVGAIVDILSGKETKHDMAGAAGKVWTAIGDAIPGAWKLITGAVSFAWDRLVDWVEDPGPMGACGMLTTAVGTVWTALKVAVPVAWDLIQDALGYAWDLIVGWVKDPGPNGALGTATAAMGAIWSEIELAIPAAWELVLGAVKAAIGLIAGWITDPGPGGALGMLVGAVGAIWKGIEGGIEGAWDGIKTALYNATVGVYNFMITDSPLNKLGSWAANIWQGIVDTFSQSITVTAPTVVKAPAVVPPGQVGGYNPQTGQPAGPAAPAPSASAPVAHMDYSPQFGGAPLTVSFDASGSSGSITSYDWDFGDGTGGSGKRVTHTYKYTGTYYPRLTVRGPGGSSSWSGWITVSGGGAHGAPVHHQGGIFRAPPGQDEGIAVLQDGEKVIPVGQVKADGGDININIYNPDPETPSRSLVKARSAARQILGSRGVSP